MLQNVVTLLCLVIASATVAIVLVVWAIGLVNQLLMVRKLYSRLPQSYEEWQRIKEEEDYADSMWDTHL